MSQSHAPHDAAHGHDAHDGAPPVHFSLRGYAIGFLLSVVLTAIPFWLVMAKVLPSATVTGIVLVAFAVAQILVHMVYFLHLDARSEGGWNLVSVLFTGILLLILLAGTLWVMHHMNANMMPMTPHDARMVD
ncbi:MAG TPA: cytochrome o ubiquinol oxidase subunit IV [Thermomonas sp.]|jgi:cytochrome o ubiquinol oxidase operon protein cyoD|nr:cytochrome o ubiquinol oxidase subunit IV [Thermomonas sp.]